MNPGPGGGPLDFCRNAEPLLFIAARRTVEKEGGKKGATEINRQSKVTHSPQ